MISHIVFIVLSIPLSLDSPPLCMQRGRYSIYGIQSTTLLKHAVVGRGLHHADYECT